MSVTHPVGTFNHMLKTSVFGNITSNPVLVDIVGNQSAVLL
jgi:hypothetical protein